MVPSAKVKDYIYLIGKVHQDDEDNLIYKTIKVRKEGGYIVVYRKCIQKNGRLPEATDGPVHVRDVEILTLKYKEETERLRNINRKLFERNPLESITL